MIGEIKVIVVCGGACADKPFYKELLAEHDKVVVADSGAELAREVGVIPDAAVGDFDSITPSTLSWLQDNQVRIIEYAAAKDKTDGELAIETALEMDPSVITLTATLGGRPDHMLANLFLLRNSRFRGMNCRIIESTARITLVTDEAQIHGSQGETVSLLPLASCTDVVLEGFKYQLEGGTIEAGATLGMSNLLLTGDGKIKIGTGQLLVVQNTEEK